jgi:hypothetical protein
VIAFAGELDHDDRDREDGQRLEQVAEGALGASGKPAGRNRLVTRSDGLGVTHLRLEGERLQSELRHDEQACGRQQP